MKEIVVATAGWVFIGDVDEVGTTLCLTNASCIRTWGTTAGLGEIALKGPTLKTVLDYCGTVKVRDYVARIDCVK